MRDSTRIQRITGLLAEYWLRVPDWRLCQLFENLKTYSGIEDMYYVEDDKFEQLLKDFFQEKLITKEGF